MGCDDGMTVPPEPDLPVLHQRSYDVTAYRESESRVRLRGRVRDTKPPGMYVPGDPEPLTVHHMVVDIVIEYPTMLIVEAGAVLDTHPHAECTTIESHYDKLVGLSIARGFTHKVRELFGGPRGCTHTTALIQAMAPVAIQTMWSMMADRGDGDDGTPVRPPMAANATPEQIHERFAFNLNTCHVWAEDGPRMTEIARGEHPPPPLWAIERLEKLGMDPAEWRPGA